MLVCRCCGITYKCKSMRSDVHTSLGRATVCRRFGLRSGTSIRISPQLWEPRRRVLSPWLPLYPFQVLFWRLAIRWRGPSLARPKLLLSEHNFIVLVKLTDKLDNMLVQQAAATPTAYKSTSVGAETTCKTTALGKLSHTAFANSGHLSCGEKMSGVWVATYQPTPRKRPTCGWARLRNWQLGVCRPSSQWHKTTLYLPKLIHFVFVMRLYLCLAIALCPQGIPRGGTRAQIFVCVANRKKSCGRHSDVLLLYGRSSVGICLLGCLGNANARIRQGPTPELTDTF